MSDSRKLYEEYARYNILYNQLNLPSPSIEYSWRRTKILLQQEARCIINKFLPHKDKIFVADLGCGNGALLIRLAQEIKDKKVIYNGFELAQAFVDYGNQAAKMKQLKNLQFCQLDMEKDELPQKFDLIICSEVLEHLHKPLNFLKKVYQALNMGGYFLLTTPNSKNLIKYPFGFLKNFIHQRHERSWQQALTAKEAKFKLADQEQHIYIFGFAELKKTLQQLGFSIYRTPRSTTVFGGAVLDNHPGLMGLTMIFDSLVNLLALPQLGWDNIMFCKKESV